jgi:hypothetical protein
MKTIYHRKKNILENCVEEGGIRGERSGLRKESGKVSQRGEDLAK